MHETRILWSIDFWDELWPLTLCHTLYTNAQSEYYLRQEILFTFSEILVSPGLLYLENDMIVVSSDVWSSIKVIHCDLERQKSLFTNKLGVFVFFPAS